MKSRSLKHENTSAFNVILKLNSCKVLVISLLYFFDLKIFLFLVLAFTYLALNFAIEVLLYFSSRPTSLLSSGIFSFPFSLESSSVWRSGNGCKNHVTFVFFLYKHDMLGAQGGGRLLLANLRRFNSLLFTWGMVKTLGIMKKSYEFKIVTLHNFLPTQYFVSGFFFGNARQIAIHDNTLLITQQVILMWPVVSSIRFNCAR